MKSVRGVFETTGVVHGLIVDVLALFGLGETALLIALMMFFLPVISSCSIGNENLYTLFQISDGCKHLKNVSSFKMCSSSCNLA